MACKANFWRDCRFFRVIQGFVAQTGINGDPEVQAKWQVKPIKDDPVRHSNKKGTLAFATSGPDARTTQIYFNLQDNRYLDKEGFATIGEVVVGMDIVKKIFVVGDKVDQAKIIQEGNSYFGHRYKSLSYIQSTKFLD